ncbi:MAG: hypothetical protein U9Q24_03560 [Candidatus Ratteibacteria bacterium]|nr:hypothetical protein [Candidatus Ratteibacteria bacterium]
MKGDAEWKSGAERRKFVRLTYVLPVEFYMVSPDHQKRLTGLIQGFTRNVGKGGLCLEVNNLEERRALRALSGQAELLLYINLPFNQSPVETFGRVAWFKKLDSYPHKFLLGVSYLNSDLPEVSRPIRFAKAVSCFHRAIAVFIIFLFLGLMGLSSSNVILRKTNKRLVGRLIQISEEQSRVSQEIFYLDDLKEVLDGKLEESRRRISNLKARKTEKLLNEVVFQEELKKAHEKLENAERKLKDLEEGKVLLQRKLAEIKERKAGLDEKSIKKMYNWLKMRQNKSTGLVLSYEGDPFLEDWAFTYDQALAAQCFLLFKDYKSTRKIFDFYLHRAKKVDGGFTNAYDVSGGHVVEYVVHSGPNMWLGLAVLHHISETGDKSYLPLAEEIADWVIVLQNEDPEGGIKGGPAINWVSTEHNLDAYAFFNNLYKATKNKKYLEVSQKVLTWLKNNAYIKAERRLKRGRGDATIATDTFSWAIAALGPALLTEQGMNPDDILEFAEKNCKVTVDYSSPSGDKGKITGFDFAKPRHIGRGGIISSEWTAQMVVSFRIMCDFYFRKNNLKKAKIYQDKAEFFLAELDKLTIDSNTRIGQRAICLPYSTHQNVDTGHGWRTPAGRNTGCIAGTVYAIFAKKGFNPFEIK